MLARLDRPSHGWLIVACGAAIFAALFATFGEARLFGLHAGQDLGLFLQSLLGVAHGIGMQNAIERALRWLLQPCRCDLCGHPFYLFRWQVPVV